MSLRGRVWFVGVGVAVGFAGLLVGPGSPAAAVPGRDGLLAVEPLIGEGIVLVDASGQRERRVCANGTCGFGPARPSWSPDGRTLVLSGPSWPYVIYVDGSCLQCDNSPDTNGGSDAAFTTNPTLFTAVTDGQLIEYGEDGLLKQVLLPGPVSDGVWSSHGVLAVVEGGWIWTGQPGQLHRLTLGTAPAWSPNGRRVAFDRGKWVMVGSVQRRSFRRLVRGTAPAWSPDGRWIAVFSRRHRLSLVRASGGSARWVGNVRGVAVDWQPLPAKPPGGCLTPPGSTVLASDQIGILSSDTGPSPEDPGVSDVAFLGCQRKHRTRAAAVVVRAEHRLGAVREHGRLAGRYAAILLEQQDIHYGGFFENIDVFDLDNGTSAAGLGGESYGGQYGAGMDSLVLNSQGFTAVHAWEEACQPPSTCYDEQIQAVDSSGFRVVDSASTTPPAGTPPGEGFALTDLALSGDTLTWRHNGQPESTQLH